MPPTRGKFIPENRASRIPRTHICIDSEARILREGDSETHTFMLASASCDKMSRKDNSWMEPDYADFDSPAALWDWIGSRCKPKERTIVVAHNLAYDLRITNAFILLPERGWTLGHFSLQPGATWASWHNEKRTMVCVDSLTWFPTSIAKLGQLLGIDKAPLPTEGESDEAWRIRCNIDVSILRAAWLTAVKWLRESDLGNWRPTGAGMAWSSYRHRHITDRILAHDNSEQRERERRAAWTGRAEPWRFGRQSDGPFIEWDFTCSYATIAADSTIPVRYLGELRRPSVESIRRKSAKSCILSECIVSTEIPTVPTIDDGRVIWPVGTFQTTLWENELELAVSNGATIEISRAWAYRRAPALRQWAEWVLPLALNSEEGISPIVRILAKHWSRALIGRFGSRFPTWEEYGDARQAGAMLSSLLNPDTGESGQLLEVGGKAWRTGAFTDHPQSSPQVMSWIMAEARCRLWHATVSAGQGNVLYVDTDSLIVNPEGSANLQESAIPGLRKKGRYNSIEILGARKLVLDREIKAAGVPRGSRRASHRSWIGEAWTTIQGDLNSGSTDSVRITPRKVTIRDHDSRRKRIQGGISVPYRMEMA